MELFTLLVASVVILVVFLWYRLADPRLPPCPIRPLPVVGHLFFLARDTRPQFQKWRKLCGDIYSLYMGGTLVVVLNGYDLIKEALVKKADVFSDVPASYSDQAVGLHGKGIMASNGQVWKEQRTVSLAILREFGMGKNSLAEQIQEEVGGYLDHLSCLEGKPTDICIITNISISNVICSILFGQRFQYEDKDFQYLIQTLGETVKDQQNVSLFHFLFWLRYIPGDFFNAKKVVANRKAVVNVLSKYIKDTRLQGEKSKKVNNFIDSYFNHRNKRLKNNKPTSLDDQNLLKVTIDLIIAGSETTSTTIYWCILYMLNYPEVQEKVYQEIKDKVGTDRTPTMQDKTQLIYLNAVIAETQRLSSIVPLSLTHLVSEDVTLQGYTLPKGTHIISNLDSVLHDPATWGADAMSFRPERFIDNNGKLMIPEQFIPFSIGRRVCLGEAIAKMELFLFLCSMFQKFHFLPSNSNLVPPLKYEIGIAVAPKHYKVKAMERIKIKAELHY